MTDQTMDNLLDETLDDLADLPSIAPFPAGAHRAKMFVLRKMQDNQPRPGAYVVKFEHQAVLELANATDAPPKEGDVAMLNIFTKKKDGTRNEIGEGQFKQILAPIAERLQIRQIGPLLDAIKDGVEVGIVTGTKKQKDPQYPDQMTLNKIELV